MELFASADVTVLPFSYMGNGSEASEVLRVNLGIQVLPEGTNELCHRQLHPPRADIDRGSQEDPAIIL